MVRRVIFWLAGIVCALGAIGYFGASNMPLAKINDLSPVKLQSPQGTLSKGSIDGILINGQTLALSCELSGNVFKTDFSCDKPLTIAGTINVSLDGAATLSHLTIAGNLSDASDWMRVLNLPPGLNANLDLRVTKAKITQAYTQPLLSELNVSGDIKGISIMRFPIFTDAIIATQQSNNPIELSIEARNANQANTQLNLKSVISDNVYETTGTLTGENLSMLSGVLSYFGQPISANEWQITLRGKML